jgi:hypothetical protein
MYSYQYFVIENVTSGRNIRISTCGCGYDSQITLRDWSTDTYLAYNDDNGPACSGTASSLDYSGNSSYPHVKVILNQYNCTSNQTYTYVTVTYVSENLTPSDPSSVSVSSNPICSGTSTQLTANGAVGTVYWYTGGCGSSYYTTGNPINVSPSSSTTYYARNYNNGNFSNGCASATVSVNPPAPGAPSSASGSSTSASTANISWASSSNTTTYYWVVSTSPSATYGTGSWYGTTAGTSTSVSGLSANTAYYLRVYANNSCGSSGYTTSSAFTTYPANPTSVTGTTSICNGGSTTLTANGNQGTVYWYTGSCGGTPTSPSTGNTLTVSPSTTTTYYARNYNGNYSAGCASATVTVTANLSSVSLSPGTAQSICVGGSGSQLTATETGGGTITGRQWGKRSSSGGEIIPISGATSATYTPTATDMGGAGTWYVVCTSTPTCGSATVSNEVTVTVSPTSAGGTATAASSSLCSGSSTTVSVSGYTGTIQWQQSANGSTGWGNVSGGSGATSETYTTPNLSATTYYKAVITSGACSAASSTTASVTVNALPTVAAITGTAAVCTQFTTQLACSTAGGVWSSSDETKATVNSSGLVTGVAQGPAVISYTVTNGSGCSAASTATVTVSASLAAPTSVTATPASIQSGQSSNLNATSAGNTIYWYTAATGGSAAGSSASGANFSVSPTVTTTYYAEANSTQSFYINTLTANNSYVTDHNSYTGDDRGGIAVTASYYYYTGDNYTVRYSMPGLTNPLSCTRRDGLFSDLGTGTLYTLHNGTTDPVYGGSNMSPFAVTNFRTMSADLATIGASAAVTLSSAVSMNSGSAAIYAGSNFVILQNSNTFYRVDIPSGTVTNMGSYTISRYSSESWATWGVAELNNGVYSVLYRDASTQTIKRLNLTTGAVTTLATFSNLSDLCSFTYSPTYSRWYFHYEGSSQFGGSLETAAYADGTHTVSSAGCPSASRTAVTVTVANPPTVTTASITDINATTATGGGNVTDQGGAEVTARGVCWSITQTPLATGSHTTDGTGTGTFTSSLTDLTAGTLYYVRAYATNTIGTSYGSQVSFTSYSPGTIGSNQSVCSGANPALFTSVTAAVGMPGVTYQWQSSTNNSVFNNITGATSLTYQAGALSAQMYYRRNAISGSVTLSSNVITISINSGIAAPSPATATPPTILAGQSSNLNATSTDNNIKWYDDPTAGTLLTTVTSGTNYAVSPSATTTYYAQAVPISCSDNTLETILSNLNSNYVNITSQIPSPYAFTEGASSNYINDGGNDMYDGGNYVSTNNNTSFSYNDNSVLTSSIFGTGGKYFTRKVNNLFVLAADMNNVSWFKVAGDYGTDGGGSKSSSTFSITVECRTYNCFLSRVYGTSDPSINELFIIPANSSATHTGIANTSNSYHQLNSISASTRMYYLLYAGTSGGLISDASAQNIATAFITQTQAVVSGAGGCPSASRTPVTVTVSSVPTVTTAAISAIAATTATGGGNVTADGGSTVSAKGVCWSTSQNPTIALSTKTADGTGTGSFTSSITGLTAGTTYYVRAYATNAMGTGYGSQVSFAPFQLGSFPNINKTYGDPPFTLVNPTSGSPGAFSYTSGNTDVATVLGNTVTLQEAGTSTITATQAASGGYGSATTSCLLTVSKANQVLTLNIPTSQPLNTFTGGSTLTISATSSAGLPVTIAINTGSSTATATLTPTANPGEYILSDVSNAGIIVFDASQAGNVNYNAATISQSLTVTMGNQVITFNTLPSKTYGDPAFTVTATGGASGNAVTFTSSNTAIATCSGTNGATVTIEGAGSCLITANQAGNASWNAAAAVSRTLTVGKATPVISNFDDISKSFDAVPFTLNASSASTGAFTYTSANSAVGTISGNTVTVQGVGTSTLTANQAADNNYFAASATATLTVGQAAQTISITAIPDIYLIDFEPTPITVTASSSSGLPVTLTLQSGSVATIDGTTLTSTGATGSVTVIANQAGNASFAAATQVTEVFAVTKANQTITFDALPLKHVGDPDFDLMATTSSELLITYTSSNTNVATITNKTVHIVATGTTNITASQAGNAYYNAATPVVRAQLVEDELFKNWIGTFSTDWNDPGNWNPSGVPVITDNLIIGTASNQPHVTKAVSDPAVCNKLSINTGCTLTIDAGKALTINGEFTNNGSMLIESSAEGTGSLITNSSIANNGTISIQRYITKNKWHMVSSPVFNATANTYLGDYLQQWTESEAKWIDIEEPSTVLNVTEGYGLWTTQSSAHTYTYTGTPNTGNKTKTLTFNEVPFMDNDGANLLGNPYPSSIDWSELDDTYGSVYYWVGNGIDGDGSYVTWLNSLGEGSRYMPPMQGFFIVTQAEGTFSLANSNRAHSNASFYKSTDEIKDNLLVLETVSKNISDKLYLQFDPSTDQDFELRNDAYKFMSGTPGLSELYSYTGAGSRKLSIDVRPRCEMVQLGFTNTLSGDYQIRINEVFGQSEVTLEDTKTNTFTDLQKGSYSFSYATGENDKRFKLHFAPLGTDDVTKTMASIYSYNKTAYINLYDLKHCDIYIYTIAGQLVASRESASGMVSVNMNTGGVYIVKVVSDNEIMTKRIFINQ